MAALTSSWRQHILFLVLIIALVEYHNNIRERCALLRLAIIHPTCSPWHRLMDYGDASSFLLLTGITREAFYILLDILLPQDLNIFQNAEGENGHYLTMVS